MVNENDLVLKPTEIADLRYFFQFQLDAKARYLAAFTSKDSTDEAAYLKKMTALLSEPTVHNRTIFVNGRVVGSVAKFEIEGNAEITYWIDRNFWGKGIMTKALHNFLAIETARPILARVAFDNYGSQRVLEKCGFKKTGNDKGFANARQAEIEEYIYTLA